MSSYLNCPRCRLTIRLPFYSAAPEHCPRCERKHGVREAVFLSSAPSRLLQVPDASAPGPARPPVASGA
jgi:hypothetical protein